MKTALGRFTAAVMLLVGVLVPVAFGPNAAANVKPGPPVGQWQPMYALHPMSTGNSVQGYGYASRCLTILDQNANPAWSHVNQWPCDQPFGSAYNNGGRPRWWLYGNPSFPGYYQVLNEHNGICLDVAYSSQAPGAQVIGYYCSNQPNQMFSKVDIGNGTFALVAVHSNQCLTLDDWGNAYWATLLQDYCNFSPQVLRRQAWTAHGPDNPNDADMVTGYLDGWWAGSSGISVWGWALTPQAPAHPLGYRTTVNGTVVTPGGLRYGGSTHRPDVNSYWNWGYHNESGFSFAEPYVLPPGNHNVCVQAQSYGYYDDVACRTMTGTSGGQWLLPNGLSEVKLVSTGQCVGFVETGDTGASDEMQLRLTNNGCSTQAITVHSELVSWPLSGYRLKVPQSGGQGLCVTQDGTSVRVLPCSGWTSQVWVAQESGSTVNFVLRSGANQQLCLTATGGTQLLSASQCSGDANQVWTDPPKACVPVGACGFVPTNPIPASAGRIAARNYAIQYYQYDNPTYGRNGNDCTNFISQALFAGGYTQTNVGHYSTGWYFDLPTKTGSAAWVRAAVFVPRWLALNRITSVSPLSSTVYPAGLQVGDIITMDYTAPYGYDSATHQMIVVEATGDPKTTWLMQHSSNQAITLAERMAQIDAYGYKFWVSKLSY